MPSVANEPPSISACLLCGEHVDDDDEGGTLTPVLIADSSVDFGVSHRECLLRDVMGGIGHLIAHEHWCVERHDPDAGLTYRQSALLCAAFATIVGVDGAARRD